MTWTTTFYSRNDRNIIEPRAWTKKVGTLRVEVHRVYGVPTEWFFTCDAVAVFTRPAGTDLELAKEKALRTVYDKAHALFAAAVAMQEVEPTEHEGLRGLAERWEARAAAYDRERGGVIPSSFAPIDSVAYLELAKEARRCAAELALETESTPTERVEADRAKWIKFAALIGTIERGDVLLIAPPKPIDAIDLVFDTTTKKDPDR